MRIRVYALLDEKLGQFNSPICFPSDGVAQRTMQDEVNRAEAGNAMNRYPEDFAMYRVAEFDPDSGEMFPEAVPQLVRRASALKV